MVALSHKKLYGREAMLRALEGAGQFAHVDPKAFGPCLDLIRAHLPKSCRSTYGDEAGRLAAPQIHKNAFSAAETIYLMGSWNKVLCCLCFTVEQKVGRNGGGYLPPVFTEILCPTFLGVAFKGVGPAYRPVHPFCRACWRQLNNRYSHVWGVSSSRDPNLLAADTLAWLMVNPTFRRRVDTYACSAPTLRFDPRRALALEAA